MKQFKSHKLVHAVKIAQIVCHPGAPASGLAAECHIIGDDGGKYDVDHAWLAKHSPKPGGYFVRYADGYQSYSPASAFEEGYSAVVQVAGDDADVETEIMNKGLNAPRIANAQIDDLIKDQHYHVFPGTTTTVCCLVLENGFTVIGKSACASPENFDEDLGRRIAARNARNSIWDLEGYLLKQALFEADLVDQQEKDNG